MNAQGDLARVVKIEIDPELVARAASLRRPVVVMPVRSVEGRAVYTEASVLMVKRLKAARIDATFLDLPEQRTFEVKKSALAVAIPTYVLGIASAASWDTLKLLLRAHPTTNLSVTYVDLESAEDGARGTAWRVDGNSESVLDAIDRLRRTDDEPHG